MTAIPMRLPSQATRSQIKREFRLLGIICMPSPAFDFYFSRCFGLVLYGKPNGNERDSDANKCILCHYLTFTQPVGTRSRRSGAIIKSGSGSNRTAAANRWQIFFLTAIGERWMFHEQYHLLFWFSVFFFFCFFWVVVVVDRILNAIRDPSGKSVGKSIERASVNLIGWKAHGPDHAISY